jgi:hypothetical protein
MSKRKEQRRKEEEKRRKISKMGEDDHLKWNRFFLYFKNSISPCMWEIISNMLFQGYNLIVISLLPLDYEKVILHHENVNHHLIIPCFV